MGLAAADLLALTGLVVIVLHLRFGLARVPGAVLVAALLMPPFWVVLFAWWGLYRFPRLGAVDEFRAVLAAAGVGTLALMSASYLLKAEFPRSTALSMLPGGVGVTLCVRLAVRRMLPARPLRTVVVGVNDEALRLARALQREEALAPLGFVDVEGRGSADGLPVIGTIRELDRIVAKHALEALDVAGTAVDSAALDEILRAARRNGIEVRVSAGVRDVLATRLRIERVGDVFALLVRPPALETWQAVVKRGVDVLGALALGAVAAPLGLLIAAAVKVDSPGPVLFRQERVTKGGRTFTILKFRTMVVGAPDLARAGGHDVERPFFKLEDDPRVTRVGRFLRRWSLDELPQLWNVLKGDMSLVGPRPLPAEQVRANEEELAFRHAVRAGLTGWWQIRGRSDLDEEEALRRDLFYVLNWSLGLDLYILLATAKAVVAGRGAR